MEWSKRNLGMLKCFSEIQFGWPERDKPGGRIALGKRKLPQRQLVYRKGVVGRLVEHISQNHRIPEMHTPAGNPIEGASHIGGHEKKPTEPHCGWDARMRALAIVYSISQGERHTRTIAPVIGRSHTRNVGW